MIRECILCFGTGQRQVDIGDDNDVLVKCDDCRGTGIDWDLATSEEREKALDELSHI